MKASRKIFLFVFASLVMFQSAAGQTTSSVKSKQSHKSKHMKKNNVAGCWNLVSGYLDNHGKRIDVLGAHPGGMLIFTKDLHFTVIVHNPDIAKFASGDRSTGTPEEYKTAVTSSLGVYGTYTIDENGNFFEQHVIGSTFQNMNGSSRGPKELTEHIEGNTMSEELKIADGVSVKLVWQRAESAVK
jgi:Lipocalin-like domain